MLDLKALLRTLEPGTQCKLELMSGRRPRVFRGNDVHNLKDEILIDDEVLDACRAAGGGTKVDDVAAEPVSWSYAGPRGPILVTLGMRGREVAATFVPIDPENTRKPMTPARGAVPPSSSSKSNVPKATRKSLRPVTRSTSNRSDPALRRPTSPAGTRDAPGSSSRGSKRSLPAVGAAASELARTPRDIGANVTRRDIPVTMLAEATNVTRRDIPVAALAEATAPTDAAIPTPQVGASPTHSPPLDRVRDAMLEETLRSAKNLGATDVLLFGGRPPQIRVSGALLDLGTSASLDRAAVLRYARLLLPERLNAELARLGSVRFTCWVGKHRVRVDATKVRSGPALALRLLGGANASLEALGLPTELTTLSLVKRGLVLVAGPSGHGKTTTLAALTKAVLAGSVVHVVAIESAVELPLSSTTSILTQLEVDARGSEVAVETALRLGADVIVLGDIADATAVRGALAACDAGCLVLGTLAAASAEVALRRLADLLPRAERAFARRVLARELVAIVGQRLVPTRQGPERVPAVEVLPASTALSAQLREARDGLAKHHGGARHDGLTLLDSLIDLVATGRLALEEALPWADDPGALSAAVKERE